ncbi:signal recognition particle-docking protein FtsY [Acidimangrovimonas sediminis]|uniref:signal recognition particle-docking protein FtsY n=1 Tax=Acidimangrovimonas sediminis TaxID=2056283 RepID=UPI000C7FF6A3|nr:signal recognition particle-docking protein FtsY [Acidimangrovimonas sediminis]
MSFFKKLKDRMFKSSSKLGDGLESLVEDGASEEVAEAELAEERRDERHSDGSTAETAAPPAKDSPVPKPEGSAPRTAPRTASPAAPPPTPAAPAQVAPTPAPPTPAPPAPKPPAPAAPTPVSEATPQKPGFIGRALGRTEARRVLDDEMLESLEELLIQSDMGVDTAVRVTANLAEGRYGRRLSVPEIKRALADEIARIMDPVAKPLPLYPSKPQVVLVVGVNGSGKTTTIGKLAAQFRAAGKKVVIAAGDTFRAAAVEQLQVWGERAGVPVMTAPEGSDPASLAFEAMTKAQAEGADLLMIDTAGRLQNRADLMEELAKIVRVIRKKDPDAPHNTLLVLDATTGQNALSQVETFRKLADVSGLVMTKLDGTARGGVLVALADRFGLPIHAIGVGEQIDDLAPFDPEDFARALTGAEG